MNNIHTYYINLDHRQDRKILIEEEIKKIGIKTFERIDAIHNENGQIGCISSHIKCLEKAIENNYEKICILEDDFFLINDNYKKLILPEFKYDIYMLGGSLQKHEYYDNNYKRIIKSVRAEGYIICNHYFKILKDLFDIGLKNLMIDSHEKNHIDIIWNKLQKKDIWIVSNDGLIGGQREGFSDILNRNVKYRNFKVFKNNKSY